MLSRIRTKYAKITLLSFDEKPLYELQGNIVSGSIPVNGNSAVRRTLNISLIALDNGNEINIHNKIKVAVGEEVNGKISWHDQGIFVVFNRTSTKGTNGYKVSITGRDKMAQLDGTAGGTLPASVTFDSFNTNEKVPIPQIIREAVMHYGGVADEDIIINDLDNKAKMLIRYIGDEPIYFNDTYSSFSFVKDENHQNEFHYGQDVGYREMDLIYDKELILKAGDTVTTLLDKVVKYLGNYEYFFDINGKFIFQEKKNYLNILSPLTELVESDYVASYSNQNYAYSFKNDKDIISINYNPKLSNIKNDFIVWGKKKGADDKDFSIMYHLAIDSKPSLDLASQYFYKITDSRTGLILRYEGRFSNDREGVSGYELIGLPCDEWREELYRQALMETVTNGEYSYYDEELLFYWRQIYDTRRWENGWNPDVKNNPEKLVYWLDFIDDSTAIGEYSVNKIGRRSQIEENDEVSHLFAKEIPSLMYFYPGEDVTEWKDLGYDVFQVPERFQDDFIMSSTGVSALDRIRDNLYKHLTFNASITITCLPKYNLEPNTLVYVEDVESGIKGNYIITQFTLPLTYSGKMTITLTEALSRI